MGSRLPTVLRLRGWESSDSFETILAWLITAVGLRLLSVSKPDERGGIWGKGRDLTGTKRLSEPCHGDILEPERRDGEVAL